MIGFVLDPTPDEARSWLRQELLAPEYQDRDLLGRITRWFERQYVVAVETASRTPLLGWIAAMLIALLLLLGLVWLLSRTRTSTRSQKHRTAVLEAERISAASLRQRAVAALEAGAPGEALIDAYRALAVRQIERGWLEDTPGATAHEIATDLSASFPNHAEQITEAAWLFDAALYGDHPTSREQAESVLALDDDLATTPGTAAP